MQTVLTSQYLCPKITKDLGCFQKISSTFSIFAVLQRTFTLIAPDKSHATKHVGDLGLQGGEATIHEEVDWQC